MRRRRSRSRRETVSPNTPFGRYWLRAQRPLNCLVFVLPLLALFEVALALSPTDLLSRTQIGQILDQLGGSASYLPALLVVVTLLAWHWRTGQRWRVNGRTVALMHVEGLLLALPLLSLALLGQRMHSPAPSAALLLTAESTADLLAGVGGGIYEEFLFRLIGLNLFTAVLLDVLELPEDVGYLLALTATAVLFSLYHFWGEQPFAWGRFLFLAAAGGYLGGVYILRGFGVAVGAHVSYNVLVWLL